MALGATPSKPVSLSFHSGPLDLHVQHVALVELCLLQWTAVTAQGQSPCGSFFSPPASEIM